MGGGPGSLDNDHRWRRRDREPRSSLKRGGGTEQGVGCPGAGSVGLFARRVNLPNIMEIYSRGTRLGVMDSRRELLCNSLATARAFGFLRCSFGAFSASRKGKTGRRGSAGARFKLNNVRCARRLKTLRSKITQGYFAGRQLGPTVTRRRRIFYRSAEEVQRMRERGGRGGEKKRSAGVKTPGRRCNR